MSARLFDRIYVISPTPFQGKGIPELLYATCQPYVLGPLADPFRDCQECCGQDTHERCRKRRQQLLFQKPSDKDRAPPPADGAVTFGKCSGKMQKLRFPCLRIRATAEQTDRIPLAALPDRPQQGRQTDNTNGTSRTPSSRPEVPSPVSNNSRVGPVVLPPSKRPPGTQRWQSSTRVDTEPRY
jgi:hypothetical protein